MKPATSTDVDNASSSTYIDAMTNEVALAEAASGQDPASGLRAARALRELAERLEALQVQNARGHGWSWQEIAVFLGVSKQAVHKKYSGRLASTVGGTRRRSRRGPAGGTGATPPANTGGIDV
jgi:DNA-directed RNA polymerase specialized sigma24 family protein